MEKYFYCTLSPEHKKLEKKGYEKQCSLFATDLISKRQKLANYKTPDYFIIARADMLDLIRLEMDQLVRDGGFFYEIYRPASNQQEFKLRNHQIDKDDILRIVIFIDDAKLDVMAETLKVETRFKRYACQVPFRWRQSHLFEQFNAR